VISFRRRAEIKTDVFAKSGCAGELWIEPGIQGIFDSCSEADRPPAFAGMTGNSLFRLMMSRQTPEIHSQGG